MYRLRIFGLAAPDNQDRRHVQMAVFANFIIDFLVAGINFDPQTRGAAGGDIHARRAAGPRWWSAPAGARISRQPGAAQESAQ